MKKLLIMIIVGTMINVYAKQYKRYPTYHVTMYVGELFQAAGKKYAKRMTFDNPHPKLLSISHGRFYALKSGHTIIKGHDTKHLFTWKVTIKKVISAYAIHFSKKRYILHVGETRYLPVTFTPKNTTYQSLTYKASNHHIKILSHGSIKASSIGKTTLKAYSTNHKIAACQIIIKK